MQKKLAEAIEQSMPKFNQSIVEGFHKKEFEGALNYYDQCLRMIFRGVEKRGVFFRGVEKVNPREFMDYIRATSTRLYDVHKETLYPVRLMFEYKDKSGQMVTFSPTYTMLPYTDRYGDLWLRGVWYSLQFVLAERGLPVTKENTLFVKVLGFKFKIGVEHFKYSQVYQETGVLTTRSCDINLSSNRFYSPTSARRVTSTKTPTPLLAWYIFAKMGFDKAMTEYGECEYAIGEFETITSQYNEKDRWEIFTSSDTPNLRSLGNYISHDIAIAVRNKSPKRKLLSTMGLQYACSLLFVADCVSSLFDLDKINDPDYWKLIIGRCSVRPGDEDAYILRLMNEHFDSIEEYLDEDSIKQFAAKSIVVNDMFELFNYIIANRSEIVQTTDRASMFDKEIASLEFTLDMLITAANNFKHDIKNNSDLSQRKIARFLSTRFRIKEIDNARSTNLIQESTPTDNPYIDYMLGCMPQDKVYTNISRNRRRTGYDVNDSAGHIHASVPLVNSFLRVSEPNPDGRGWLNPHCTLSDERVLILNPKFRELYRLTEHRLRYRESK